MPTVTPHARNHEGLAALSSRYVDVEGLPWTQTRFPGVEVKVLMENKETGLTTALTRLAPGAVLLPENREAHRQAVEAGLRILLGPADVDERGEQAMCRAFRQ